MKEEKEVSAFLLHQQQLQALTEAILIFESMEAQLKDAPFLIHHNDHELKRQAISELFAHGLLVKQHYNSKCPLCERFRLFTHRCVDCPWPRYEGKPLIDRCVRSMQSPYAKFCRNPTIETVSLVLALLRLLMEARIPVVSVDKSKQPAPFANGDRVIDIEGN